MPGRRLLSEGDYLDPRYGASRPDWVRRRAVLRETLQRFRNGRVYLDTENPRVCIRGPEDRSRSDLGYPWLPEAEVFPFFELRSAAQDCRNGALFSASNARQRIAAQLETLMDHGIRHVVFGASGCGAFENPTGQIAMLYREEIEKRRAEFHVIAFAIHQAGYGPDNLTPFRTIFSPSETEL